MVIDNENDDDELILILIDRTLEQPYASDWLFEEIPLDPIETRGAKRKRAALGGKAMKKPSAAQAMKAKEEPSASPKAMKAKGEPEEPSASPQAMKAKGGPESAKAMKAKKAMKAIKAMKAKAEPSAEEGIRFRKTVMSVTSERDPRAELCGIDFDGRRHHIATFKKSNSGPTFESQARSLATAVEEMGWSLAAAKRHRHGLEI